jgi:hypothetical protein
VVEFRGTTEARTDTVVIDNMRKWIAVPGIGMRRGDAVVGARGVAVIVILLVIITVNKTTVISVGVAATT